MQKEKVLEKGDKKRLKKNENQFFFFFSWLHDLVSRTHPRRRQEEPANHRTTAVKATTGRRFRQS